MRVIAVSNQKGGVGKTTSCVALGGLMAEAGHRVLLIDLDPHGSLTSYFFPDQQLALTSYTLFQERQELSPFAVRRVISATSFPRIAVIPSATALATLERQAIGQDGMGLVLTRALQMVEAEYDYVILDTPPLLGVLMVNALAAAHYLLMPTQTEYLALKGLERMLSTLNMMARSQKRNLDYTIIPVMFDRRTQASVTSLRQLRNTYGDKVWPGHIPIDTRLRDASKAGIPPNLFDAKSRGVEAYTSCWHWLEKILNSR